MEGRRDRRMAMQAVQHGWHVPVKPLGFCGVQASQEIGLACIPYRRLSMQSIIFFHRKSSMKRQIKPYEWINHERAWDLALEDRRIRRVPGSCPPVIQDISLVPDEPGEVLTIQRLIGSPATNKTLLMPWSIVNA
jgi:hypothetical protein